jgi:hypothetical protein
MHNEEIPMKKISLFSAAVLFSVVLITLSVVPAGAKAKKIPKPSKTYYNYARIDIGGSLFTDDLEEADFDAGISGSLSYGRHLLKYLVIEGSIGGFTTSEEFEGRTFLAGDYTRTDSLLVNTVRLTVKGELPLGRVRLFAGGGVGGYFLTLTSEMETDNLDDFESTQTDTVFGVHGVTGCYFDITRQVFIGVEGMYYLTDDIDIDERAATVPVGYQGNLDGFTVAITGGFKF